jgi:hypothetical protein
MSGKASPFKRRMTGLAGLSRTVVSVWLLPNPPVPSFRNTRIASSSKSPMLDPGGLWGTLFPSQAGEPPAAVAGLGGPWLLTLAIVAVNYGIALALVRRAVRYALAPALATLALIVAGNALAPDPEEGGPLRVAAIQPGAPKKKV